MENDTPLLIISNMYLAVSFITNDLVDKVLVIGLGVMWLSLALFN